MKAPWRWAVCVALVAAFVAVPFVVRALPAGSPGPGDTTAAQLLERMRSSWSNPYAGYAETTGSIALPASDQLDSVATLLGSRTQIRVWWRSAKDWRADTLSQFGETSTRTTDAAVSVWDYEDNRVVVTPAQLPGTVRLPQDRDTVPPQLAERMLSETSAGEVSGLPARRVAGRDADGLRMQPSESLSSIGHVDVWADRASGIPVLVEVFGRSGDVAAMSSTFLDFTAAAPSDQELAFTPPPGARVRNGQRFDLARQLSRSGGVPLPGQLLGFTRSTPIPGFTGVGEYGRGVTQIVVGQLPGDQAASLRQQLSVAVGAQKIPEGVAVSVGPVGLLLTSDLANGRAWLVTGTLTTDGLVRAAAELTGQAT
ncbi:hypothetical protein [Lapillicoccus sp.]|uniref:hypothetical protein n=1 Tax=Lapillicoccus sp. TaxID=1909287 RepID=UPI0027CD7FD2|nr:transcriptional regulator [Actinomycetota bacterium]